MTDELEQAEAELKAAQERVEKLRAHDRRFAHVYLAAMSQGSGGYLDGVSAVVAAVCAECAAEWKERYDEALNKSFQLALDLTERDNRIAELEKERDELKSLTETLLRQGAAHRDRADAAEKELDEARECLGADIKAASDRCWLLEVENQRLIARAEAAEATVSEQIAQLQEQNDRIANAEARAEAAEAKLREAGPATELTDEETMRLAVIMHGTLFPSATSLFKRAALRVLEAAGRYTAPQTMADVLDDAAVERCMETCWKASPGRGLWEALSPSVRKGWISDMRAALAQLPASVVRPMMLTQEIIELCSEAFVGKGNPPWWGPKDAHYLAKARAALLAVGFVEPEVKP